MRARTVVAAVVLLVLLGGVAAVGFERAVTDGGTVSVQWVSDTATDVGANHHAPAVGVANGTPTVFAPISGRADTDQCGLVALRADDGSQRWEYPIPSRYCTIHSVADPTVADVDGDDEPEVLAATTERALTVHDARTGDVEGRYGLTAYGYTRPLVVDLDADESSEIVVVDVDGSVFALDPDGTRVWVDRRDDYAFAQPVADDVDADGDVEVVVGLDSGSTLAYGPGGTLEWNATDGVGDHVAWMTPVDVPDRPGVAVAVATTEGTVTLLDGTGDEIWERDFGDFAAVHAAGDADGDGAVEVYAVARDGVLRSVDAATGAVEWSTTLTTRDVNMMPPPSLGDLDGDGSPELVAAGNDGVVSVVDPATGGVLGTYGRDVPILTHPTVADADGDGVDEAYITYGDGRVVALAYEG